jgi:hypothetical protein
MSDSLLDSVLEDVIDGLVHLVHAELAAAGLDGPELPTYVAGRVAQRFGYRVSLPELSGD